MSETSRLRSWLALGASAAAIIIATPALAQSNAGANTNAGASMGGTGPSGARPLPNSSAVPSPAGQPLATGASANGASGNQIEELVVTAQRREETIQSVPVAVSAFSADALKAQRLDGGENLLLSVPNVNYSRGNFGGYNFQIRGIGTKVVSNTGDAGVSFNVNALPVAANHLGDTDFYDVERVEVLRGPQGTLYGRSATGGAVNVITAKPTDHFGGSLTYEAGNFGSNKVTGFVNVPVNDFFQFRVAGFFLNRDGYGTNQFNGHDIDGRDLNSIRFSSQFKFNDRLRLNVMFEDFNEKDDRNRVGKQLCIKDPGKTSVGGVPTNIYNQGFTSQGCTPGTLYQDAAYGTVNSLGTFGGLFTTLGGLQNTDAFGKNPLQNHNLHDIQSQIDPKYEAKERLAIAELTWDVRDNIQFSSITGYNRNTGYSIEDYNRVIAQTPFGATPSAGSGSAFIPSIAANPALISAVQAGVQAQFQAAGLPAAAAAAQAAAFIATPAGQAQVTAAATGQFAAIYQGLFPGGVVKDPQIGSLNRFAVFDRGDTASEEKTQEFRVSTSYKGAWNFSAGAIYINSRTFSNYYVFFNPINAYLQEVNTLAPGSYGIDNSVVATGSGHNYFDSKYGYELNSYGAFGEVYWHPVDDIKVTGGFRYSVDNKKGNFYPSLLFVPGNSPGTVVRPKTIFEEPTGRVNIEWTPHLSFTNQTLVYGTYSHGYKSGGFNTPCQNVDFSSNPGGCGYPFVFQPEILDAFEIGTKNTLLNGSLILNANAFFYDYQGYQISAIVKKSAVNSNINAEIYGAELEAVWQPVHNLTLNMNLGYLHTKVKDAVLLDQSNLTQGDPNLTLVKAQDGSNCVVNTAGLANFLAINEALPGAPNIPGITGSSTALLGACSGAFPATLGLYNYTNPNISTAVQGGQNVGQGVLRNLEGNDLPNSPDLTLAIGAQYVFELPGDWKATARGDYYWQDDSFSRIYNTVQDHLQGRENINATLAFDNPRLGINVQFYIKNLTDDQTITDTYLTDASSGLFINTLTLDPRTYGVSLTKRF